ncbi:DegT/DnrJ/EryC1/StrS family aminotransferase [Streptomyces sp. NPDC059629]|uniref:DegT/DnrJ/EryC1/StrS family aminotransferase n=1 Tax=Streptomyces sp. NPDC059629 TaxID=3346889 RepID=UPI0036BCBDBE
MAETALRQHIALWRSVVRPDVRARIAADVERVTATGMFTGGPFTGRLEASVGAAFGRHAVAVRSGMDGMELLLETLCGRRRRVMVPGNCFASIPALAARFRAEVTAVPVEDVHLAVSPEVLRWPLDDRPVVVWIHHGGMVAAHAERTIAALRARGCTVVEDCAYVLADTRTPRGPGTWGDAALLSFAPTKPLSGPGGGAVLTADARLAQEITARRSHSGQEQRWAEGEVFLRNRAMGELDAVVAYHQWRDLDVKRQSLDEIAGTYLAEFARLGLDVLPHGRVPQPSWGRLCVDLGGAMSAVPARQALADRGIGGAVMFETPWFDYQGLAGCRPSLADDEQPWGELRALMGRTLLVPFHPALSPAECRAVADALSDVLGAGTEHHEGGRPTRTLSRVPHLPGRKSSSWSHP